MVSDAAFDEGPWRGFLDFSRFFLDHTPLNRSVATGRSPRTGAIGEALTRSHPERTDSTITLIMAAADLKGTSR
jgi:hypothetical protein